MLFSCLLQVVADEIRPSLVRSNQLDTRESAREGQQEGSAWRPDNGYEHQY